MMIKLVQTKDELEQAFQIRMKVFVDEQCVPEEEEIDSYDETAHHFICYIDTAAVATGRLRFVNNYGKIERIAVLKTHRQQSIGKKLMKAMEKEIVRKGYHKATLHAQIQAKPFYQKLGYTPTSADTFLDGGIPHIAMGKHL